MSERAAASADLVVPTNRHAVRALASQTLYLLEQAGEIAREILDSRIVAWTEQGWTQRQIADEIGCAQQTVADRQRGLGVQPTSSRGRPRKTELPASGNSENGSGPEVIDAEVIPGQLAFPEQSDEDRLDELPADLAARVQADTLSLDEAEQVADEREQRLVAWAVEVRRAISVLAGLAGHPIPAALTNKLDQDEQGTLTLLLAGVPPEEQT